MTLRHFRSGVAAIALAMVSAVASAQHLMPAPTPTADALAAQMRVLAQNPRDVSALLQASELSIRLADPSAAMVFLARAQAVDAGNPRLLAGRASVLVAMERPGEALRLYDQAERAGVAMDAYLAQRGLAYDLTGQGALAQRDYRRSLSLSPDDETTRRLGLSLGISGKRDEALALLDPLLRRNDRAAWRAWSFVLAMAGDQAGARQIATGMMAGGAALAPFLERLTALPATDRAFAVHFGQLSPSPTRMADARLAPVPAGQPPAQLASRELPTPRPIVQRATPAPVSTAAPIATPAPTPAPAPVRLASAGTRIPVPSSLSAAPEANVVRASSTFVVPPTPAPTPTALPTPAPATTAALPTSVPVPTAPTPPPAAASLALAPTPVPSPTAITPTSAPVVAATPVTTAPAGEVATLPPRPAATPTPARAAPPIVRPSVIARTPEVARRNTRLLASIIDTIDVPASELGVSAPRPPAPAVRPVRTASTPAKPPETVADETPAKTADARKSATTRAAEAKAAKPAEAKTAAETKAKTPAATAVAKKVVEPRKPDPAKAEPQRWWVQVAGGANEADLGKDWKRVTAQSAALKGKGAYTTPLRATNRLLTGPFKSQEEAMALVNTLKKDGTSAFAWQSPAGQKVSRLPAK